MHSIKLCLVIPETKNKEPKVDGDDNQGDKDEYDERPRDEQDPLDKKKDSPSQQKPGGLLYFYFF